MFDNLSIEAIVAWLFALAAAATILMTTGAYIYQIVSRRKEKEVPAQSLSQGHFFVRVFPNPSERNAESISTPKIGSSEW